MPGVLTNVIKGKMNSRVESRLSKQPGELHSDYLKRLEAVRKMFVDGKPHVQIAETRIPHGQDTIVARTEADKAHARDEFFGDTGAKAFFPGAADDSEDEVVRGTMIRALDLAIDAASMNKAMPVVIYWIVTDKADTEPGAIEGYVSKCDDRQIDVMILTPRPKFEPPSPANGESMESMWVIGTPSHIANLEAKLDAAGGGTGYPKVPVTLEGVARAKCLQVVGY